MTSTPTPTPTDSPASGSTHSVRVAWWEWSLLAVILLVSLVARTWGLSKLAVEHFDEGVYASNLYFSAEQGYEYPDRHLYAPPLVPSLIEWSMTFLGDAPWVPMLPGIVCGALTTIAVWWLTRIGTGGAVTSLLTAWLVATNGFLIFYSRTALTEPVLGLWWVLALALGLRSLLEIQAGGRGANPWTLGCGILCGLCWWTKYNGWLPAFILSASALAVWLTLGRSRAQRKATFEFIASLNGVMLMVYAPYVWSLQKSGGYLAVAAHHQSYVTGWQNWWLQFGRQTDNLEVFHGLGTVSAMLIGFWAAQALIMWHREQLISDQKLATVSVWLHITMAGVIALFSTFVLERFWAMLIVVAWFAWRIRLLVWQRVQLEDGTEWKQGIDRNLIASIVLVVWLVSMAVLTPLYTPYPRLAYPGVVGLQVMLAITVTFYIVRAYQLAVRQPEIARTRWEWIQSRWPFNPGAGVLLFAMTIGLLWIDGHLEAPFTDDLNLPRTELRQAVRSIILESKLDRGPNERPVIVYVYGEPAVYWHLSQQKILSGPVSNLDFVGSPVEADVFLIVGPHARQTQAFQDQLKAVDAHLVKINRAEYHPSLLVLMDEINWTRRIGFSDELSLYRVQ